MTQIAKKLSIGSANAVRGGFKAVRLFGLRQDPNNSDHNAPLIGDRERVTVLTIVGLVNGYKEKTSETMDTSYAFMGEFQAINMLGERIISPVAYLPEPAQGMIKAAVDGGATAIEIGFVIDAVRSDDTPVGYEYQIKPLVEPKASTALDHLAGRLGLGAPVAEATESAGDNPNTTDDPKAPGGPDHKPANGKKPK